MLSSVLYTHVFLGEPTNLRAMAVVRTCSLPTWEVLVSWCGTYWFLHGPLPSMVHSVSWPPPQHGTYWFPSVVCSHILDCTSITAKSLPIDINPHLYFYNSKGKISILLTSLSSVLYDCLQGPPSWACHGPQNRLASVHMPSPADTGNENVTTEWQNL